MGSRRLHPAFANHREVKGGFLLSDRDPLESTAKTELASISGETHLRPAVYVGRCQGTGDCCLRSERRCQESSGFGRVPAFRPDRTNGFARSANFWRTRIDLSSTNFLRFEASIYLRGTDA